MGTENRFIFESYVQKKSEFNRYAVIAVAVHLLVFLFALFIPKLKQKPIKTVTPYVFEMVSPAPVKRARVRRRAVSVPKPVEKMVKAEPVKKIEKSWQKKKEEKVQEKKVEEKIEDSPNWDEIEEPVKENNASVVSTAAVSNEMTIQQPDFPYSYYGAQIRNAVEQNWRLTPQELLGSESQLVVLVKFTIGKNGRVSGLEIVESSWNSLLDKFALRAIEKAKIPPLPGEYEELTIHYRLVLRRK